MSDNYDYVTAIALRAISVAQLKNHQFISIEHILFSLLEQNEIKKCLKHFKVNEVFILNSLNQYLETMVKATEGMNPLRTKEFELVIGRTIALAQFSPRRNPNGLDIFFQLIHFPETSPIIALLLDKGIDLKKLKNYILQGIRQSYKPDGEFIIETEPTDTTEALEFIKKYCIDLNELATMGKIDPVIGRLSEIKRIIQILARRTKNNVALVGEPGVGKTAIAEGMAVNIVNGDVPDIFKNSTIWSLDISGLVAGTRFRGDFEERMKYLLKAFSLIEESQPILFIDEIHTIMEAGSGNKGSLDVSNILKPALARGKLRCIGSTTDSDWRKHFEKDRALLRRFKKIFVDEPSVADTKLILRGLRKVYEEYHGVTYLDDALDAAVDLSVRYIDGKLPDKAIDILDESGARHRVDAVDAIIDVTAIEFEISQTSKIPQQKMHENEERRLQHLEKDLKSFVFGQDHAILKLVDAVFIGRAGLREANKPEGSFLFTGPTGVGKSQPLYSKILTPNGWTTMGEIQLGNVVNTPDGNTANVIGIYPQGIQKTLRLTFVDGRTADCSEDHLWKIYNKWWKNKEKIIPSSEIIRLINFTKGDYYVPLSKPISYEEKYLPIEPYLFGCLIGDGNYSNKSLLRFTSSDAQILQQIDKKVIECGGELKHYDSNRKYDWNLIGKHGLREKLSEMNLNKLSFEKSIPEIYRTSSIHQRMELIKGLMDTDGEVGKNGNTVFYTSSFELANNMIELIRGIGGICRLTNKQTRYAYKNETKNGRKSYRLAIRVPNPHELFTLERKLNKLSETYQYFNLRLKISKIEYVGEHESQCIMIDHADHLYITDNYVVTHNTELARQLATFLGWKLIKFDMTEYQEKHSVAKFIGSPPGYVGFGEGSNSGDGLLVTAIENSPCCVLLLDEIEKAHEDVFNILLQVMDDAKLTNSSGKPVGFRNVILIMTSNAGVSKTEQNGMGFIKQEIVSIDESEIKRKFPPEFRNRLDATVEFNSLDKSSVSKIVHKFMAELQAMVSEREIRIEITDSAKKWLAEHGYDAVYGARPLARLITEKIKQPLSRLMLFGGLKNGGILKVCVENGFLTIQHSKKE